MKLSFGSISNYMMCPRKFYEVNVTYAWKDASFATRRGTDIHETIEKYIVGDSDELNLPAKDKRTETVINGFREAFKDPARVVGVEEKFAVDADFNPVSWTSPKAILRGKVDVYTFDLELLDITDWKSGKKRNNALQAHVYGLLTFKAMSAKSIRCRFDYLDKGVGDTYEIKKDGLEYTKQIVRTVLEAKHFPERRNPLCPWCPVKSCSYWREQMKKEETK